MVTAAIPVYHPAFLAGVNASALVVPDDPYEQVAATIGLMTRYVVEDSASREVQELAGRLCPAHLSPRQKVEAIFSYVKELVAFTSDENLAAPLAGVWSSKLPIIEVLIRPRDLLEMCRSGGCRRMADCDDFSMLAAALLRACGIRSSFVTVAADLRDPSRFSHVYVAAYPNGERVPLDTSHGPYAGWEVEAGHVEEWSIDGGLLPSLLLLAAGGAATWLLLRGLL